MKSISIWKDSVKVKNYQKLEHNLDLNVLIIGGGISGVSALYHLKDSKMKVALVEQNKIGLSTTANSTGKLTIMQNDLIDKIRKFYNDDIASKYIDSQKQAIDYIVKTINKNKIDCDLEKVTSSIYTNNNEEINKLKELSFFLKVNNYKITNNNISITPSKYSINYDNSYIFNPLKFINGILINNDYEIYEHTSIIDIKKRNNYYYCYTNNNIIKTKYIILTCHYPYFIMPYFFPFKVSLEKSYLCSSKYNTNKTSLISYSNPFVSIRTYKDNLVYLSNTNKLDKNTCDKYNFNNLIEKCHKYNNKIDYLWSNVDIMTSDSMPIIGKLKNKIFIATGYNTWGLANGFYSGKIIYDIIFKKNNKYIKLFDPKRKTIKHCISYAFNSINNIKSFIKSYININKSNYICPHMGCKLTYNEVEKTFDCPCHGSRFDINKKVISGPANKNIND